MSAELFDQKFQARLRCLLPESPDLQTAIIQQLWQCCNLETRALLTLATPTFFRILAPGGQWKTSLVVHYKGQALLCHCAYWDHLDQLCKVLHQLTGISEIHIRGTDLYHRCRFEDGHWIREVMP